MKMKKGTVESLKDQVCKPGRNQGSQKNGPGSSSEAGWFRVALRPPDTQANGHCCHLHCSQHWILTAAAITINLFPTFLASLNLSLPQESKSRQGVYFQLTESSSFAGLLDASAQGGAVSGGDLFPREAHKILVSLKQEGRQDAGARERQMLSLSALSFCMYFFWLPLRD